LPICDSQFYARRRCIAQLPIANRKSQILKGGEPDVARADS